MTSYFLETRDLNKSDNVLSYL